MLKKKYSVKKKKKETDVICIVRARLEDDKVFKFAILKDNFYKGKFVRISTEITLFKDLFKDILEYRRAKYVADIIKQNLGDIRGFVVDVKKLEDACKEAIIQAKESLGMELGFRDVLDSMNITKREERMAKMGYDNFLLKAIEDRELKVYTSPRTIGSEPMTKELFEDNKSYILSKEILWKVKEEWQDLVTLAQVKDTSTGKLYFLRVPDDMRTIRQAKAWTFQMEEHEYNPVKEA